jgi:hypothetical protein
MAAPNPPVCLKHPSKAQESFMKKLDNEKRVHIQAIETRVALPAMEKNLARLLDIAAIDLIFALKELTHQLATLERALAFRFEECKRQ